MADPSPLVGLLDRAGRVFTLAGQLARAFTDEYDQQGSGLRTVDPTAWVRQQPAFNVFCNALLELRDEMQPPPGGFAPVAEVLMEAARVAKQIRDVMRTTDGQAWQALLDFRFHFNSIVAKGGEAIRAVTKAQRLDDPCAFVDPLPAASLQPAPDAEDDEPYDLSAILDYAITVRDSLDTDLDVTRDEALTLIQVRKAYLGALHFGLVRASECPEVLLNREGGKRKLDYLIPILQRQILTDHGPVPVTHFGSGGGSSVSPPLDQAGSTEPAKHVVSEQVPRGRCKRSTERGEARSKLIAALTKHHRYADGSCLNQDPIRNIELAKLAGVSPSTASTFFKNEFEKHTKYKELCRDVGLLVAALKLLNNEFAPHNLYGGRPADEGDEGDLK
jgi:hypothetical protein